MENCKVLLIEESSKIKMVKLSKIELAIRLAIFYQNEIVTKYVLKKAENGGYDNQNGFVVIYDKSEDVYVVISSSDQYNYITRIINKI